MDISKLSDILNTDSSDETHDILLDIYNSFINRSKYYTNSSEFYARFMSIVNILESRNMNINDMDFYDTCVFIRKYISEFKGSNVSLEIDAIAFLFFIKT